MMTTWRIGVGNEPPSRAGAASGTFVAPSLAEPSSNADASATPTKTSAGEAASRGADPAASDRLASEEAPPVPASCCAVTTSLSPPLPQPETANKRRPQPSDVNERKITEYLAA